MKNIIEEIRRKNSKTVYTCSSIYNVLLALCIVLILEDYKNSYIVMFSPEKKVLTAFHSFSEKMKTMGIRSVVINKHKKVCRLIGLSDIENKLIYRHVLRELDIKTADFVLVNFSWNQRMVRYPASMYLKQCKEAVFVEEGATQWITPDDKKWYRMLKRLYGNQAEFWKIHKVKSIYVQQPDKYPGYLKPRLTKFVIENCFDKISGDVKDKLLGVFLDKSGKEELACIGRVDGIIFTQPISEDGFVSEREKIKIYTELSEFYSQYGRIALKIHPRDTAQYHIRDVGILKGAYPSELLSVLNISFKFAVGLCTSAIETVNADIRINLNERFLTELKYELREPG